MSQPKVINTDVHAGLPGGQISETHWVGRWPGFWIIIGIVMVALLMGIYADLRQGPVRLGVWTVFIPVVLLISLQLRTKCNYELLTIIMWPVWRRKIPLSSVRSVEVIRYRAVREFGGWGIRFGHGGIGYIMPGNVALKLQVAGYRPVIFSTSQVDDWLQHFASRGIPTTPLEAEPPEPDKQ